MTARGAIGTRSDWLGFPLWLTQIHFDGAPARGSEPRGAPSQVVLARYIDLRTPPGRPFPTTLRYADIPLSTTHAMGAA